MSLTRDEVCAVIDTYLRAWTSQDPDLIVGVFTPDAVYQERVLEDPIRTTAEIRRYWQAKVVAEQANIETELCNVYLDGNTAIAEWEARFDDLVEHCRKRMREVAILQFRGGRIAHLREYWTSQQVPEP